MRYVALLRGIGPLNPNMRNEKLRTVLESLGYQDVQTVISSGNVIFETKARDVSAMERKIEDAWPKQLGFRSTTIIRSRDQILDLVAADPFGDHHDTAPADLQVTFLKHAPEAKLEVPYTPESGEYTIVSAGDHEICSVVNRTTSGTPDLMRSLERTLGKEITTRTWKTVNRIAKKLD